MRVRPTFESVTQGIDASRVKYPHHPALDIVRSPQYNLFYEAAADNLHDQNMRIHTAERAEAEIKQAAAATGADFREVKEEIKQMQKMQMSQEIGMNHFAEVAKQEQARQHHEAMTAIQRLDVGIARAAQRVSASMTPEHSPPRQGVASGLGPARENFTPADSQAWHSPQSVRIVMTPQATRSAISSPSDAFGAPSSGARTASDVVLAPPQTTSPPMHLWQPGVRSARQRARRTLNFEPPPGQVVMKMTGTELAHAAPQVQTYGAIRDQATAGLKQKGGGKKIKPDRSWRKQKAGLDDDPDL